MTTMIHSERISFYIYVPIKGHARVEVLTHGDQEMTYSDALRIMQNDPDWADKIVEEVFNYDIAAAF